jgi:hypothetical protein
MAESLQKLVSRLASLDKFRMYGRVNGMMQNPVPVTESFDVAVKLITASTSLRTLALPALDLNNFFSENSPLQQHFMTMTSLTALELRGCNLSSTQRLERLITSTQSLRHVDLSMCHFGSSDPNALGLSRAMQVTTTITELDLSCTSITLSDHAAFIQGIIKNRSLHTLRMHDAKQMPHEGLEELARALRDHPGLTRIELSGCNVYQSVGEAWGAMVECNSVLQHLTLKRCEVAGSRFVRLGLALARNETLRLLDLRTARYTEEDTQAIGSSLKTNTLLHTLLLAREFQGHNPGPPRTAEVMPIIQALNVNVALKHVC